MARNPAHSQRGAPGASALAPPLPAAGESLAWRGLAGSARGLAIAGAAAQARTPLVVVARDARSAQRLSAEIRFYLGEDAGLPVLPFPDWECLPYDRFSPHEDIVSQRLLALHDLPGLERGVVVLAVPNLLQRLAPPDYVLGHTFVIERGARLDPAAFRQRLDAAGYRHVSQVMAHGEYAVRGGLLDVFPMGADRPYRLDLFDEEIDTVRDFDPETQRSGEHYEQLRLLPAREVPLTEAGIKRFRAAFRSRFEGDPQKAGVYRDVSQGIATPGIEFYLPLFFERTATFFDYLPAHSVLVTEEGVEEVAREFGEQATERHDIARLDSERPPLAPGELFLDADALGDATGRHPHVVLAGFRSGEPEAVTRAIDFDTGTPPSLPVNARAERPYGKFIEHLQAAPGRVLVVAETAGRREAMRELLRDNGISPAAMDGWREFLDAGNVSPGLAVAELADGLELGEPRVSVITESQLYGDKVFQRRRRSRRARDPETIIRSLAELKPGDAIVHEEHGVGRYRGLQTLDIEGMPAEFLCIEYQGGDKLYIPVLSLHLVSRFVGADPEHAPLHRLGTDAWEKARRKARERAHDVAAELLELQAMREARSGHAFPAPDDVYAGFAAAFPFEETPDQAQAIGDVLSDMTASRPMDRLVCGDVGFGKTEVALRAALLAVQAGRQVGVLVPTTLLAQQHFDSFRDRFADLPVSVELLSRFRSGKALGESLTRIADGRCDIVIGTHRLLQDDVRFANVGLIIIDEEHRFGVRQKEKLKRLRSQVDILSLTATPIPRTLNMAMAGVRDISIIATPPRERLSIKTFVQQWNPGVVREACLREIRRGGQVYYLHNDVRSIERAAADLAGLVPEAEIRIAHGQISEVALERIMQDFYHQRFNVLVCSTIIESGIDVPSANTIVINRADRFGLAQLHQLRGRVGRSHHQAYAYLLVPDRRSLSNTATKRLQAIESLEDLGAGFALASHDLEIRGAGELLGESQSGLIDEVGYTLYTEYLDRAIASLREGAGEETTTTPGRRQPPEINLHIPALFPDDYLPDVHARLVMYKRIASAQTKDELTELQIEVVDRFGLMPEPVKNYFRLSELKLRAAPLGIRRIDIGADGGQIVFDSRPDVDPGDLVSLIQSRPGRFDMRGAEVLRVRDELPDAGERIEAMSAILDALAPGSTDAVDPYQASAGSARVRE